MNDHSAHKTWLSPLTFLSFMVVSVSGLLLTFHIRIGNIKTLHEWIGYAFMAAGAAHLLINRRPFAAYFRTRSAAIAVCAGLAISLGIVCTESKDKGRPNPMMQLLDANRDGVLDESEIANAALTIKQLDTNHDGKLSSEEVRPKPGPADKKA